MAWESAGGVSASCSPTTTSVGIAISARRGPRVGAVAHRGEVRLHGLGLLAQHDAARALEEVAVGQRERGQQPRQQPVRDRRDASGAGPSRSPRPAWPCRPRRPPRRACRRERERRALRGPPPRESQRHVASHRESGDPGRRGQLREDGREKVGGILDRAGGGRRCLPASGQVRFQDAESRRERAGHARPHGAVERVAVDENHRGAAAHLAHPSRLALPEDLHGRAAIPITPRAGREGAREAAVPPPGRAWIRQEVPWAAATAATRKRPRPAPRPGLVEKKGSKIRSAISGGMPRPESSTDRRTAAPPGSCRVETRTSCPGSPASTPFSIRQSSAADRSFSLPGTSGSRSARSRRSRRCSFRAAARSTRALTETGPVRAPFDRPEAARGCGRAARAATRRSRSLRGSPRSPPRAAAAGRRARRRSRSGC